MQYVLFLGFLVFLVLVLSFVVVYWIVLFGVLYAAEMKDTARARLQTANKKQTRTLPHFMCFRLWFVCWMYMLKLKPGSWQMTTLLVKLRDAHSNPRDNSSKKNGVLFRPWNVTLKEKKGHHVETYPPEGLHEFASEFICDYSARHFWYVLK